MNASPLHSAAATLQAELTLAQKSYQRQRSHALHTARLRCPAEPWHDSVQLLLSICYNLDCFYFLYRKKKYAWTSNSGGKNSILTGRNLVQDQAHQGGTIAKEDRCISSRDMVPSWPITGGLTYNIWALLLIWPQLKLRVCLNVIFNLGVNGIVIFFYFSYSLSWNTWLRSCFWFLGA